MPMLAELQQDFAAFLRSKAVRADGLGVRPAGLTSERRLSVYRNHHRISLAAALAANFPITAKVVGEEAFRALAGSFVAIAPPVDPCLSSYGADFAGFLDRDVRVQGMRYLADIARFDWACARADQAADIAPFGPQHLATLDGDALDALVLAAHPSLTLLRSPFPLLRIRDLALGASDGEGVSLEEGGVQLMIWRREGDVVWADLDAALYRFVETLAADGRLGSAAETIDPVRLPAALADCVLSGAFAASDQSR